MLFDLSGKRKRMVQVVYAILAILMGGSLVLFGIGSDAPGGILDSLGLGNSGGGSSSPQYEQEIENAEEKLATNPDDTAALLNLIRYHGLAAQGGVSADEESGQITVTEEARGQFEDAASAWERYLKTKPDRPNTSAATSAAQAYQFLNDADGAASAQEVVAKAQNTAAAYGQLAYYLYADFKFEKADAAAKQAVAKAEPAQRKNIQRNMDQIAQSAREQQKQIEKQAEQQGGGKGEEAEPPADPFGSLGGGTGFGAPTAPAP